MVTTTPWLERKDDTIPLTGEKLSREAIEQYVNPLINQRLDTFALDGREVDGAVDVLTLWRQGRLARREHSSFWTSTRVYTLMSVAVGVPRISTRSEEG